MEVPRVGPLSVGEFRRRFRDPGRPVIIQGALDHWPARRRWSVEDLVTRFGDRKVPVEHLDSGEAGDSANYVANVYGKEMTVAEYVELIRGGDTGSLYYLTGRPLSLLAPELLAETRPVPYFSQTLIALADLEWKLWFSPPGCCSAMHYDGLESCVAQVVGRKRWTLFPASTWPALGLPSAMPGKHFTPHFSPIDVEAPDLERFPDYADAERFEFTLEPGDLLYFPAYWPHHVRSLTFSMSVNSMCIRRRTLLSRDAHDFYRLCLAHALRRLGWG